MRYLVRVSVVALLLVGCGGSDSKDSDTTVLATIGSDEITAGDYWDAVRRMQPAGRPDLETAEARTALLGDLINKRLLERASIEMLPELGAQESLRMERYRRGQLGQLLEQLLVRSQVKISEEDKDRLYRNRQKDVHIEAILVPTEEMGEAMLDRLRRGAEFADIAAEYSILEYEDPLRPGVVGWMTSGRYPWEMEKAVWDAEPGDIVGPFEDKREGGWFVVRVGDGRSIPPEASREEMDAQLEYALIEKAYLSRQAFVQDSLRTAAEVSYPPEGEALMMFKYYWEPQDDENPYAYLDEPRVAPTYTAAEETVTVVRFGKFPDWSAGHFTEEHLSWSPSGLWPRGHSLEQLHEVYDRVVREYLIREGAKHYGLDASQDLADNMHRREMEMRVRLLYRDVITPGAQPTQEEIEAWFEENRERYKSAPSYRVAYFATQDRDLAEKIREEWMDGAKFTDIRDKYAAMDPDLESQGDSPFIPEGQEIALDDQVAPLDVGGFSEVFARQDHFFVVKLNARRPARLVTYEEAKEHVDQDARTVMEENKLLDFLAEQKEKWPVVIHEEAVAEMTVPEDIKGQVAGLE